MEIEKTHLLLAALADPAFVVNDRREMVFANRRAQQQFEALVNGRDLALSFRHPNVLAAVQSCGLLGVAVRARSTYAPSSLQSSALGGGGSPGPLPLV